MSRPFEDIPYVSLPSDYDRRIGEVLSGFYAQHGPIFRTDSFGSPAVFLVGPEANRFVMTTNRLKFSHRTGWGRFFDVENMFGNGLLTMDGDEHAQHRRMMNPAFTVNYMDRYLPIMQRIICERVDEWLARGTVDLYEEARKITFDIAAEALAGMSPGKEVDQFRDLYMQILYSDWSNIAALKSTLNRLLRNKLDERRAHPTDDVLGLMVQAQRDGTLPLTDEQIIAHTNILLVAGHETSTSLSAWLLYLLVTNPDYTKRLLAEQQTVIGSTDEPTLDQIKNMKLLHNALQEAERMYPPVPNGPRGAAEEFEFEGYHVPAGVFVFYSIIASHYNPHIFLNPDRFDPDRFAPPRDEDKKTPYSLVGFGGGPRICLGINFAQVEIKALTSYILRYIDLSLVPGQTIQQVYGATGFPLNGIRMKVRRR